MYLPEQNLQGKVQTHFKALHQSFPIRNSSLTCMLKTHTAIMCRLMETKEKMMRCPETFVFRPHLHETEAFQQHVTLQPISLGWI